MLCPHQVFSLSILSQFYTREVALVGESQPVRDLAGRSGRGSGVLPLGEGLMRKWAKLAHDPGALSCASGCQGPGVRLEDRCCAARGKLLPSLSLRQRRESAR